MPRPESRLASMPADRQYFFTSRHGVLRSRWRRRTFVRAFADGHINLLIIVGEAGLSKGTTVRNTLGDDACWIEGNATAFGIYLKLYAHRDVPVVLDDLDELHASKNAIRLLKCLCQTEPEKRVAWPTAARELKQEGVPREFTTRSRVVIISNEWHTRNIDVH